LEYEDGKLTLQDNKNQMPVSEFVKGITKFRHLDDEKIEQLQNMVDHRMNVLRKLADA